MLGQHITFWLDREKSTISHEKLQNWIGREGELVPNKRSLVHED